MSNALQRIVTVTLGMVALGMLGLAPGALAQEAVRPAPKVRIPVDPAVRELLEIRKALGRNLFDGTSLGGADNPPTIDEQIFADNVAKLVKRGVSSTSTPSPPPVGLPSPTISNLCAPQRAVLLQTARRLDDLAADLEESSLYLEADSLRRQAQRVRLTARGLVESAVPLPDQNN